MASQGKTGPPKVPIQGSWRRVVSLRDAGALQDNEKKENMNNYRKKRKKM